MRRSISILIVFAVMGIVGISTSDASPLARERVIAKFSRPMLFKGALLHGDYIIEHDMKALVGEDRVILGISK